MIIQTKRLILRPWNKKDKQDLIEGLNNLNVSKYCLVVPHPYKDKEADWWLNHCKKEFNKTEKTDYNFAIELRLEKKIIGGIGLIHLDKFQNKAEVGYWINEKYWKKGYASEALEELLKFAFNTLGLRRLEAGVFSVNPSSGILLQKYGFKKEGKKIKSVKCLATKRIQDEDIYGLLKEDWRKRK